MDENNTATDNASNVESEVVTSTESNEEMVPASKLKEIEETNRQLFERAKKAEGFVKVDGKWVKAPKAEEAVRTEQRLEATTGELNETQLFLLESKGITEDEDINLIQNVMKRTGQSIREVLKDDYVTNKLKTNKDARDAQNATPSSSRRTGQSENNDVDFHLAQYERTGKLPDSFELRAKVIQARAARESDTTPPWRR